MKLISNRGTNRVIDELKSTAAPGTRLDFASPTFSLFAFAELQALLSKLDSARLVLPISNGNAMALLGGDADRSSRNELQTRWWARQCIEWLDKQVELRGTPIPLPQSTIITENTDKVASRAITGSCHFTTDGLGLTPGNQFSLIQCSENENEWAVLASWFTQLWESLPATPEATAAIRDQLLAIIEHKTPSLVYHAILYRLFKDMGEELDEDRIVKSATGIRNTVVWRKLFKFQRDGVIGAMDKLERYGGCIIADSVGLGKTFEALAIIKYYELRNDRVLVLCPKRLRDNWTLYRSNDRRNFLAADRFNYDVLNHTDLSRDSGKSGDMNLDYVNWGNYDLVVIDESHNFRNKKTPRMGGETRYDRLMRRIIKEGVKTRVLMLSATPVNNRLADLRNQIAFVTENDDTALAESGIASIESTTRKAQLQFNRWMALEDAKRSPSLLMEMLGFDYFKLLDLLTIARSRKHIEKYYGTTETGKFPERLKPINIKADVDLQKAFPPIREINNEIRRLTLAAYAPLRYVLPHKQAEYDEKYSTKVKGGLGYFRHVDREESLVHLLRVNVLKRMESSVTSFALTLQLLDISATGEENIIEQESGNQMNDLEYRRKQLQKLQDTVIDLEDLSSGISIADLTLNDFRMDLAAFLREHQQQLDRVPLGAFAVVTEHDLGDAATPLGVIFCLQAVGDAVLANIEPGYPLAPHFLVHVGDDGAVLLPFTQAKQILDRLKRLCIGRSMPDAEACARFDKATHDGRDMSRVQALLAAAVTSVVGKSEERAVASLFTPGETHALKGEFAGIDDFEVIAFLVVLPNAENQAG